MLKYENLSLKIRTTKHYNVYRYRSKLDVSPCISKNFEWPTFANMNILNMRTKILCHKNKQK